MVFDPSKVAYADLVKAFFEFHDPTQGMRQGNDVGTQYRSAIYTLSDEQAETAKRLRAAYEPLIMQRGYGAITTEIKPAPTYYYAEDVPPAVPREEPARLPLPQRDRRPVPGGRLRLDPAVPVHVDGNGPGFARFMPVVVQVDEPPDPTRRYAGNFLRPRFDYPCDEVAGGQRGVGAMNTSDLELLDLGDEAVAAAALAWFVRRERRLPDHQELNRVLSPARWSARAG